MSAVPTQYDYIEQAQRRMRYMQGAKVWPDLTSRSRNDKLCRALSLYGDSDMSLQERLTV